MITRRAVCLSLASAALVPALPADVFAQSSVDWELYRNPRLGYRIELPLGPFEVEAGSDNGDGLRLLEVGGPAQIEILGSENTQGLSPAEFADFFSNADRIDSITYRANGSRWFVLSGYYAREANERDDLVFYTKYLFNRDNSAFAAFEISYPTREKRQFDRLVTRMEKSLRAPVRV